MDSTPLLAAVDGAPPAPNVLQDHPAFLRASHSPWRWIPQNILVILRGIILAYLIALSVITTDYKLGIESKFTNWRFFFDFSVVTVALMFIYHIVTFSWTFTHLYYPSPEDAEGCLESWIIGAMSLPRDIGSLRKQFYFTMLYTATTVFAFMNSTIYWFITRQHSQNDSIKESLLQNIGAAELPPAVGLSGHYPSIPKAPFSDLFGEGWFKPFTIFNLYGVTSLVMVFEILFMNSIKRPFAIGSHLLGLVFFSGFYLGWAAIGKLATGWYPFFWLDEKEVGSTEAITVYCIGFIILAPLMYVLMQGFVGIREGITALTERRPVVVEQEPLDA